VEGYQIDWEKVKSFLDGMHESTSHGIRRQNYSLDLHGLPSRHTHSQFTVISFGAEAWGKDLEELRKKDIPTPEYLEKILDKRSSPVRRCMSFPIGENGSILVSGSSFSVTIEVIRIALSW